MISEDAFRELVSLDVRGQATPEQGASLQENDETCRRWLTTLRLMLDEVRADTEIRDAQNKPYSDSAVLAERERWAAHLHWKRRSQKFAAACRARVVVAEDALRKVSGLSETADRLLDEAEKQVTDEKWLARYRDYKIRRFGQLPAKGM